MMGQDPSDDRRQRLEERQTFMERDIEDLREEIASLRSRLSALVERTRRIEALVGRLAEAPPEPD
ncbi:MAG: hypothetical protein H6811_04210 [Phycisphaeraceae bacterium]|nr:hypothetical protein [Phycisphaeraceae bacterium]